MKEILILVTFAIILRISSIGIEAHSFELYIKEILIRNIGSFIKKPNFIFNYLDLRLLAIFKLLKKFITVSPKLVVLTLFLSTFKNVEIFGL